MVISRRIFSIGALTSPIWGGTAFATAKVPVSMEAGFISAFSTHDQTHGVAHFDKRGYLMKTWSIDQRGHGFARNPTDSTIVAFTRRPGTSAYVLDLETSNIRMTIEAREGRHFYGHGTFSSDGRWLYASENDFDNERGVIGVYDRQNNYSRVHEVPSHGIGPHEIALMPEMETLAVANGGILTHPSAPRLNLNIDQMRPNLALVDIKTGTLRAKFEPEKELHKLSIRHLDVSTRGDIAFVMQWEGDMMEKPPLVGMLRAGSHEAKYFRAPDDIQKAMKNYCGSVRFSSSGKTFMVSSPRGKVTTEWSLTGDIVSLYETTDVCGVVAIKRGFLLTNGFGKIAKTDTSSTLISLHLHKKIMWDNHVINCSTSI